MVARCKIDIIGMIMLEHELMSPLSNLKAHWPYLTCTATCLEVRSGLDMAGTIWALQGQDCKIQVGWQMPPWECAWQVPRFACIFFNASSVACGNMHVH